jgi:hypothetical protein
MLSAMVIHYLLSLILLLGLAVNAQTNSSGTSTSPTLTVATSFNTARYTVPMVDTTAFSGLVTNGIIPLGGTGTGATTPGTAAGTATGTATGKASSSEGRKVLVSMGLLVGMGGGILMMFLGFW